MIAPDHDHATPGRTALGEKRTWAATRSACRLRPVHSGPNPPNEASVIGVEDQTGGPNPKSGHRRTGGQRSGIFAEGATLWFALGSFGDFNSKYHTRLAIHAAIEHTATAKPGTGGPSIS